MLTPDIDAIRQQVGRANSISCLSAIMAEALMADPDTAHIGTAVQGLGELADSISEALFDLVRTIQTPPQVAPVSQHQRWLTERNRVFREVNAPGVSAEDLEAGTVELVRIESAILDRPSASMADVHAKALLSLHMTAEGHHLLPTSARFILDEAEALDLREVAA